MFSYDELYYGNGGSEFLSIYRVVPQLMDMIPPLQLFAYYSGGIQVYQGNQLSDCQVQYPPIELFVNGVNQSALYCIMLSDIDAPASDDPTDREYLQWLLCNVPGTNLYSGNITQGDTFVSYQAPNPQKGVHRIVFTILEQFYGPIAYTPITNRANFALRTFTAQNMLGEPIAANFFTMSPPQNQGGVPAGRRR